MNFPPILFHPINSITAYKGQIIYDTPATEAKAQTPMPYLQWQPATGCDAADHPAGCDAGRPGAAAARGRRARSHLDRRSSWAAARCRPRVRHPVRRPGCRGPRRGARTGRWRLMSRRRSESVAPHSSPGCRAPAVGRWAGCSTLLLAGCSFGGLNSLDMPGTKGHGAGSYTITVELPDVATLPQNSPVMVDDVTVGSVSGIDAVQRPGRHASSPRSNCRWTATCTCRPTPTRRSRRPRCWARMHIELAPPADEPAEGKLADGSNIPEANTGRYPTTEEVLVVARCGGQQGQSRCAARHHRRGLRGGGRSGGQLRRTDPQARRADRLAGRADRTTSSPRWKG